MNTPAIDGWVADGYEAVRTEFERNFAERGEVGAALSVYRHGESVVDLWGGVADATTGRAWDRDTVVLVYSVTKGITATCANRLIEEGHLDPNAPVASYWPEFAASGKGAITVEQVLSHQAGLPLVEATLTYDETLAWFPVVEALAAQAPLWPPGSKHGYHMRTFGWLVGEIVRRVDGRTIGQYFAEEIASPLGLDFWIGLPESIEPRVARLIPPAVGMKALADMLGADNLLARVGTNPGGHFDYDDGWNGRPRHACELPSSNGIGSPRSIARLYASLLGPVDGVLTLRPETVANATRRRVRGADAVLMIETSFGLGYMLPPSLAPGCGPNSFGHNGAGGSVAFADPDAALAVAYAPNELRFAAGGDPRSGELLRTLYACVEGAL
jgi:CubicO group peptidase (beta-lactamase class C family)